MKEPIEGCKNPRKKLGVTTHFNELYVIKCCQKCISDDRKKKNYKSSIFSVSFKLFLLKHSKCNSLIGQYHKNREIKEEHVFKKYLLGFWAGKVHDG